MKSPLRNEERNFWLAVFVLLSCLATATFYFKLDVWTLGLVQGPNLGAGSQPVNAKAPTSKESFTREPTNLQRHLPGSQSSLEQLIGRPLPTSEILRHQLVTQVAIDLAWREGLGTSEKFVIPADIRLPQWQPRLSHHFQDFEVEDSFVEIQTQDGTIVALRPQLKKVPATFVAQYFISQSEALETLFDAFGTQEIEVDRKEGPLLWIDDQKNVGELVWRFEVVTAKGERHLVRISAKDKKILTSLLLPTEDLSLSQDQNAN